MNLAWIASGLPGTGGGRVMKDISNALIKNHHHRVTFYVTDYGDNAFNDMLARVMPLYDAYLPDIDVAICYDPGRENLAGETFARVDAKKKVWGMFFANAAFDPYIKNPDYVKVAHTSWLASYARGLDPRKGHVEKCIGGVDTAFWFYQSQKNRSMDVLVYPKKSGYSALVAARIAHEADPRIGLLRFGGEETSVPKNLYDWGEDVGAPLNKSEVLRSAYHRAMCYVNSESNYGWGFSQCLAEAMSCGCPIVGGDWSGFSDLLIEGRTALLVPNDEAAEILGKDWMTRPDPEKLAEKIVWLANHPVARSELASTARAHIEQFDIQKMVARFNEIITKEM